uniref:CW domain-containing protein n=1 Tax=Caenorhabditis tropicalis TaxID=1561998 RepID=A0A1I7TTL1_9PELO
MCYLRLWQIQKSSFSVVRHIQDRSEGYMNEKVIEEPANFEYDHNNFWTDGRRATPDAFNVTDETLNGTTGYRWIVTPTEASDKLSCSFIVDRKIKPFGIYVYCSYLFIPDKATGRYKIGLKRTLTTCPKTPFTQEMVTETYSSRLVAYNYTITPYFPNQWKFDFNSYFQCPNDSFVSIRGPNRVCISVRTFQSPNFCQVQAAGAELCQQNRGIGLTGPYSLAEADVIGRLLIQKSIEEPADSQYKYINYWIDGTRATQWTFNVTDETLNGTTGYRWESNLGSAPEKNFCLQMLFLFYCLFSMINCIQSINPNLKMLEIWGEMEEPNYPLEEVKGSWETCLSLCYEQDNCLLVAETDYGCFLYGYSNFSRLLIHDKSTGRYKIGLKRTLTTCPKTIFAQEVVTETYSSRLVAYNYTITLSPPNQWKFDFNYYIQCPNDSFVSIRGPNRVCISVRAFKSPYFCQAQVAGVNLCEENRGIGLTGPYSSAERYLIGGYMSLKVNEEPVNFNYNYIDFWIDGSRVNQYSFSVTDETLSGTIGYGWNTGSILYGGNCVCLVLFDLGYVYTSYCYSTQVTSGQSFCMRGAVCRTQPIFYL